MKALCNLMQSVSSINWFYRLSQALGIILLVTSQTLHAEDNPYASNFQAQNQGNLHSLQANPEPQIFNGTRRDEDNIRMLEDGYDLMGFSGFEAAEVSPEMALAHGRTIQADMILVYAKKAGNTSAASKMEMIKEAVKKGQSLTEKDMVADPNKYRYYATYWAKLPPPVLGVHVIKLAARGSAQDAEQTNATPTPGVRVIAVIHGSAAEQGGVLRGDQLLSINKEPVNDAATLSNLVRKLKGNSVTLKIQRQTEPLNLQVKL